MYKPKNIQYRSKKIAKIATGHSRDKGGSMLSRSGTRSVTRDLLPAGVVKIGY